MTIMVGQRLLNKKFLFIFIVLIIFAVALYVIVVDSTNFLQTDAFYLLKRDFIDDEIIDFEGFDNVNGAEGLIVPNIVHLIYLQETNIKFYQMVNIFSILLNHKPSVILIHCDNCSFYGKYWDILKNTTEFMKILKINKIPYKDTIFGVKYGWINYHRSDVWRLQMLMNYGGIFLDNDVYVVNSLDKYRKYEMVVSYESSQEDSPIGTQVLIAHKNARFLKAHFDSYRYNYTPSEWYWNAGHMPAQILQRNRELAHIVKAKLGTHMLINCLYQSFWSDWKELDSIHLLINHRNYLDKESPIKEFDEFNIKTYNYTYGFMVRDILDRQGLFKT